jgi:hypothetical protein
MGIRYLTFVGSSLENWKILTLVQIMNSANLISKNIVNSNGYFNESVAMDSTFRE